MAHRPNVFTPHLPQILCSYKPKFFVTANHRPPQDHINVLGNHPACPLGHTTQGCFSKLKLKNWSMGSDISILLSCVARARLPGHVCVLIFLAMK